MSKGKVKVYPSTLALYIIESTSLCPPINQSMVSWSDTGFMNHSVNLVCNKELILCKEMSGLCPWLLGGKL